LPLHFENKIHAVRQPDQEIRPVLFHDALPDVENFKAEVIVFHPGLYVGRSLQLVGLRGFPGAVINAKVDMALLREFAGPAGIPRAHVASAARGMLTVENKVPRFDILELYTLEE